MKEFAYRLKKKDDLKKSIEQLCREKKIDTAVILSGVGSLIQANIRLADPRNTRFSVRDYEIVSLTGTVSRGKCHIHISIADDTGACYGGHLLEGCLVNTTCELVIGILEEYESRRDFDYDTGYDEIVFMKKEDIEDD